MENPYQPPASADESPVSPVAGLKNPRPLALVAVWLYGISLGAEVADHLWRLLAPLPPMAVQSTTFYSLNSNEKFGAVETSYHDTYYVSAGFGPLDWLMIVPGLASCIVYLVWKYRAATNARILDPRAMTISPAMAVGSYFIPFVFFVVPYRAMAGIARATLGSTDVVRLWWALQVGTVTFGALLGWSASGELDPLAGFPIRPSLLESLYVVVSLMTFLISNWLVMTITRAQTARCVS